MLTLSPAQIDHLASRKLDLFEQRCLVYLAEQFPERAVLVEPEEALADVRLGIESASLCGCRTEGETVKFLYLRVLCGAHFDLDPANRPFFTVMNDGSLAIDERLDRALELAAVAADLAGAVA